jgi:hypothetical protein
MNATLENTKDVINQFQEETLKKINKDRNEKSVRNIQDGLPYCLEDVRTQFEDPSLMSEVSRTWILEILRYYVFKKNVVLYQVESNIHIHSAIKQQRNITVLFEVILFSRFVTVTLQWMRHKIEPATLRRPYKLNAPPYPEADSWAWLV